jgi:hypothetical protein
MLYQELFFQSELVNQRRFSAEIDEKLLFSACML